MDRSAPERIIQTPTRSPSRLVAELLPLLLVLGSTAGALTLIIGAHRRPMPPDEPPHRSIPAVAAWIAPTPGIEVPAPSPPPEPPPAQPEDLTPKEVARLEAIAAAERDAVARADRAIESLQRARNRTASAVESLDRNEKKVRARAEALEDRAVAMESEAENLAIDREILNKNRETAKASLDRDRLRSRTAHAIEPFKGPNGSWRKPIAIECTADQVKIQPDGPSFGLMDLSPMMGMRGNPFLSAVARETTKAQQGPTPDGAPSVPYILFIVRPDGIRPYYEALARLEPMGLAFGYELVAQDWEITYPDPGSSSDWDHSEPAPARWPTSRPLASGPDNAGSDRTAELQRRLAELEAQVRRGSYATDSNGKPVLFSGGTGANGSGPGTPGGHVLGGGGIDEFGDIPPRADVPPGTRPGFAANSPAWQGQSQGPRQGRGQGAGGGDSDPAARDGRDRFVPPNGADLANRGFGSFARGGGGMGPRAVPGPGGVGGPAGAGSQPWSGPGSSTAADGGSGTGEDGAGSAAGGGGFASGGAGTATGSSSGSSGLAANGSAGGPGNPSGGPGGSGTSGTGGSGSSTSGGAGAGGRAGSSGSGGGSGSGGSGSGSTNTANLTLSGGSNPPPTMPPSPSRTQPSGAAGGTTSAGANSPTKPATTEPKDAGNSDGPKIEHGLELVVVCESKGIIIHPGAYRLSHAAIKAKDGNLVKALRTIVDAKQLAEPTLKWVPRIRFLVEPGGHRTLWTARGQLFAEGLDWPSSVQTATGLSMRPPTQEVR